MTVNEAGIQLQPLKTKLMTYAIKLNSYSVYKAEDLFQDTMLRVFTNLDKFQDGTDFKAWVFIIMKRIFLNEAYQIKRIQKVIRDIVHDNYTEDIVDPYSDAFSKMEMMDIQQAIDKLDGNRRRMVELRYLQGHYEEDVAKVMEIPIGTVKSRCSRSKAVLAELLKDYQN